MMRGLFLLGAGASFGSEDCRPYCPPLGDYLYDELCKYSGQFMEETKKFADRFKGRGNFERGMVEFAEKGSGFTPYIVKIMGGYFHRFDAGEHNLCKKLIKGARSSGHEFIYATLNYDLLLERSAGLMGIGTAYSNHKYRPSEIRVIKPHGSCNTVPVDNSSEYSGNYFVGFTGFDEPMRYSHNSREVKNFLYQRQDQLCPAMSFYAPGKPVMFSKNVIKEHYSDYHTAIRLAEKIYIIGVAVNRLDEHIWKPLAKTNASIVYFGRDLSEFDKWAVDEQVKSATSVNGYFSEAVDYLYSKNFDV